MVHSLQFPYKSFILVRVWFALGQAAPEFHSSFFSAVAVDIFLSLICRPSFYCSIKSRMIFFFFLPSTLALVLPLLMLTDSNIFLTLTNHLYFPNLNHTLSWHVQKLWQKIRTKTTFLLKANAMNCTLDFPKKRCVLSAFFSHDPVSVSLSHTQKHTHTCRHS